MIKRLLAILLVPFFVVGNTFAHSHVDAAPSSSKHGRAHVHLGSADHHHRGHSHHDDAGHQHENHHYDTHVTSLQAAPVDHDSDAIYLSKSEYVRSVSPGFTLEQWARPLADLTAYDGHGCLLVRALELKGPAFSTGPPLYLLHAALRL